ncbi:helix-turn-helix transcriptional regulator [Lampropedia aestuarii]|uniref:Helix-turn-helix transcriptional regulator n=1 Tax=Lampropedia aestuarii TaxID=2562762 RepID=A0A4S5BJG5_9BURK|nr:S24 family peptidase [Lampropedia aestuarii]THJ30965.1 helix-turn-helix transcriptional regulator [Lampropedia aestuarii]
MSLGSQIKHYREKMGWTYEQLSEKSGVEKGTLNAMEKRGSQASKFASEIAKAFGLTVEMLIDESVDYDVPYPISRVTPLPEGAIHVGNERARPIYVVGKGAGSPAPERIWTDGDRPVGAIDEFVMGYSSDPEAFLIEVDGSSMYPKYEHGNFALIEPNTSIDLEDVVLVRQEDGRTLLKRLLSRRNGKIVLASYNDPARLELDELDVSWMYYAANEIARKKIKSRF